MKAARFIPGFTHTRRKRTVGEVPSVTQAGNNVASVQQHRMEQVVKDGSYTTRDDEKLVSEKYDRQRPLNRRPVRAARVSDTFSKSSNLRMSLLFL